MTPGPVPKCSLGIEDCWFLLGMGHCPQGPAPWRPPLPPPLPATSLSHHNPTTPLPPQRSKARPWRLWSLYLPPGPRSPRPCLPCSWVEMPPAQEGPPTTAGSASLPERTHTRGWAMLRSAELGLGSSRPCPGLRFSASLPTSALLSIYSGLGAALRIYLEVRQVIGKRLEWAKVGYSSVSRPSPPGSISEEAPV